MSSARKIARRYAEALAEAADAQSQLLNVASELHQLAVLWESSKDLKTVFESPAVKLDDKSAVLEALVKQAKLAPLVASFLRVLLSRMRIQHLVEIDRAFAAEVDRRQGVVAADVTTAADLSADEREMLTKKLETATGKKVKLNFATDAELIGGVVTRIGSRIYDGSIRSKLDSIKRQMTEQVRA